MKNGISCSSFFCFNEKAYLCTNDIADFIANLVNENSQITKSLNNEGVYRGSVKFGSDDIPKSMYDISMKMLNNEQYARNQLDPIVAVDKTNIDKY